MDQREPRVVNPEFGFGRARLIDTSNHGYVYVAASIAPGPFPFVLPSRRRSLVINELRAIVRGLATLQDVERVNVFRAIVMPPTARFSAYLKAARSAPIANFDVTVLVEVRSVDSAQRLQRAEPFMALVDSIRREASVVRTMPARNVKRIADVDTVTPGGLFLFNHFAADDAGTMLDLWDYLAAWYVRKTHLTNSVALGPINRSESDYAVVNWARWDVHPLRHFWHQLADRGFWKYVTVNLEANHAASMPIYCRLAFT